MVTRQHFQATNKTKDEIKSLEKQMLAAHKKDTAGSSKSRKDSGRDHMKDKEKEIRDKLVLKLKKKAESSVSNQEGRVTKVKTVGEGLESVSDEELSDALEDVSNDEEMDAVSDEDLEDKSSDSDASEIDSDEELRLTSTDDDSEKESKKSKKKKKKEKDKKEKKKSKDRDRSRREDRKQRELKKQISLAEKISSRRSPVRREREERKADLWEHEKYDREDGRRRERTPTGYYGAKDYYERRRRSCEREAPPEMDDFQRDEYERRKFMNSAKLRKVNRFLSQQGMRKEQVEKEMERAYEKYFSSLARKEVRGGPRSEEQAKEEQWERMTNPHLFGGSGGGGFRKVKPGQHYEEVQKETLQHEIRIRERREKMSTDREDHRYRERKSRESRRERW